MKDYYQLLIQKNIRIPDVGQLNQIQKLRIILPFLKCGLEGPQKMMPSDKQNHHQA